MAALYYSRLVKVLAKQYKRSYTYHSEFPNKTYEKLQCFQIFLQNRLNIAQVVAEIYIQKKLSLHSPLGWDQQNEDTKPCQQEQLFPEK